MATVQSVLDALEAIAPSRFAFSFDCVGLQVGDRTAPVTRGVTTLDRSLASVEYAAEVGAQIVVSHHPLFFDPLREVDLGAPSGKTIRALLQRGIALVTAHTNWDCAPGGINDALAASLGWKASESFGSQSEDGHPAGRICTLDESMVFADLLEHVEESLATRTWGWGRPSAKIRRAALVGGAADGEWRAAQAAGADVLITGEVKQHVALEAQESGFLILAAGHYATEMPGMAELATRLREEIPDVGWSVFEPAPGREGRPL